MNDTNKTFVLAFWNSYLKPKMWIFSDNKIVKLEMLILNKCSFQKKISNLNMNSDWYPENCPDDN